MIHQQFLEGASIGDVLTAQGRLIPNEVAVYLASEDLEAAPKITWRELLAKSDRLARALTTRFEFGERVALWAENSPDWVVVEFAAALAGLVLVPINPDLTAVELAEIVELSNATAIFFGDGHDGDRRAKIAQSMLVENSALRECTDIDCDENLYRTVSEPADLPLVNPDDPALLAFTSGTTGKPKGALHTHSTMLHGAYSFGVRLECDQSSKWVCIGPLFNIGGCVSVIMTSLIFGCTVSLIRSPTPEFVCQVIERDRLTDFWSVPAFLTSLMAHQNHAQLDLSSIRSITIGGSDISPSLVMGLKETFNCNIHSNYALTEALDVATSFVGDKIDDVCFFCGTVIQGVEILISDADTKEPLPAGQVGEIWVRGKTLMKGYQSDLSNGNTSFNIDGWFYTGDLGLLDDRNYLKIVGRKKNIIVRGGENISPMEIQNVMLTHPSVADAAVVGVPNYVLGESVACFLILMPGHVVTRAELVAHCCGTLTRSKIPAQWFLVENFPLTDTGKVKMSDLREMVINGKVSRLKTDIGV